jgi:hypothetical protein
VKLVEPAELEIRAGRLKWVPCGLDVGVTGMTDTTRTTPGSGAMIIGCGCVIDV